jgi:LPS export ABC transporter protein LptC
MKRNLLQIILGLALFGVVIQVIIVSPHAVKDAEKQSEAGDAQKALKQDGVDQSLQGMHMIETQEGGKEWELWSDKADRLRDKELLKLDQVKAIFFSKSGMTFTVTGKTGTVEVKSKNMRVEGDVVTKSSNGYAFKTQSVDYSSENKSLSTDLPVEMIGPKEVKGTGLKLKGRGMLAHMVEGTMEILNDVQANKTLANGKSFIIHSQKALFSSNDRSAKFLGNVVLDMETMRITGPEAEFDYDNKTNEIRTLKVHGGAKVSDTDKFATANDLRVDLETNKFVFSGAPRVVQNNDELKGEQIVFLDGGKSVQVLRARAKMDGKRMGKTQQ